MKRSEAEKIITDELYNYLYSDTCPDSEDILDIVLKLGMLPPNVEKPSQDVIDNCLSSNYWEDE